MKPRLAVFIHHPQCSVQSVHGVIKTFWESFHVYCLNVWDLKYNYLKKFDILVIPGGIGDSNSWHSILAPHQESIIKFLHTGKKYLGICMGAYWAGSHYFNILDGVEPVQYIKRKHSEIKRSFGTVAPVLWNKKIEHMYFYDGCAFINQGGKYNTQASYSNGDAAAIIQRNIGLIGPHLESDSYWYIKQYMKPHWHQYKHHQLLLKFTEKLLKQ